MFFISYRFVLNFLLLVSFYKIYEKNFIIKNYSSKKFVKTKQIQSKNHVSLKHICKICVVYVTLATINKNSFKPKHLTKTYSTFFLHFFSFSQSIHCNWRLLVCATRTFKNYKRFLLFIAKTHIVVKHKKKYYAVYNNGIAQQQINNSCETRYNCDGCDLNRHHNSLIFQWQLLFHTPHYQKFNDNNQIVTQVYLTMFSTDTETCLHTRKCLSTNTTLIITYLQFKSLCVK